MNLDAIRLLNALRSRNQLVIYPTTNSGYGTQGGQAACDEETPLEPISLYGRTKAEAEAALLHSENVIALRLATVFGMSPRMRLDLLVNHFVHAAVTDGYIVIFEKHFTRNFVHVRDVADCMLHCLEHADRMAGRAYNVGLDAANLSKEALALKDRSSSPVAVSRRALTPPAARLVIAADQLDRVVSQLCPPFESNDSSTVSISQRRARISRSNCEPTLVIRSLSIGQAAATC